MPNHSKSDRQFWLNRVYLPRFTRGGETVESSNYAVQIQLHGKRRTFTLNTGNKTNAADKAKNIYLFLATHGWEKTMEEFWPRDLQSVLTVAEYVEAVTERTNLNPRTLRDYQRALYHIAAEVAKIGSDSSRFGEVGSKAWRQEVGKVKLSALTAEAVQEWKLRYLRSRNQSPEEQAKARTTVNTRVRNAKSLFAPKVIALLGGMELPDPLPLVGVQMEKERSRLYRSKLDPEALVAAAERDLAQAAAKNETINLKGGEACYKPDYIATLKEAKAHSKRQAFIIFLLGLAVGLRREEIDKLLWEQVRFSDGCIRIEITDCFQPKADSSGDIPVDPAVMEFLHELHKRSSSRFVIDGPEPKDENGLRTYRAERHHRELIRWLRGQGVDSHQPIHTLRKEYGSEICRRAGIHAASRLLRHSSINITAQHYLDGRQRVVSGVGKFLKKSTPNGDASS